MEIASFQPSVTKNFEVVVTFLENLCTSGVYNSILCILAQAVLLLTCIQDMPVLNMSQDNMLYYGMTAAFCIFLPVAIMCYTVRAATGCI
jgi:hypothetical protein